MSEIDNEFRKSNNCPYCNHQVDRAFKPDEPGAIPVVGNLSICIRCAEVSEFDDEMKLIKFDLSRMAIDERLHIQTMIRSVKHVNKLAKKGKLNE